MIISLSWPLHALTEQQQDAIEARIQPVGHVCLQGDTSCAQTVSTAQAATTTGRTGEAIYNQSCTACHSTGAGGAPRLGDHAQWVTILQARDLATVYDHAINGYRGMPAKGLCMDCSDDEVKAAVDYMIDNS